MLSNDQNLLEQLCAIIKKQDVRLIVVGMPYSADGGKGAKALEVDQFIGRLRQMTTTEIDTWDGSLSSVNAQRAMITSGMKKKKRRQKGVVDVMAARLMLQEYLDDHQQDHRNG